MSILSHLVNSTIKKLLLPGMALIGPFKITSNYLSVLTIGYRGSLKTSNGKAKFTEIFLKTVTGLSRISLIISTPTAPTTKAVVVAIAGIILPAISLILKLSFSSIW